MKTISAGNMKPFSIFVGENFLLVNQATWPSVAVRRCEEMVSLVQMAAVTALIALTAATPVNLALADSTGSDAISEPTHLGQKAEGAISGGPPLVCPKNCGCESHAYIVLIPQPLTSGGTRLVTSCTNFSTTN